MTAVTEATLLEALNEVKDPCAVAAGHPFGVVDMGLVTACELREGTARVALDLTSPTCFMQAHFEREITAVLGALPGIRAVDVEVRTTLTWTEERMSPEARDALAQRRSALRLLPTAPR